MLTNDVVNFEQPAPGLSLPSVAEQGCSSNSVEDRLTPDKAHQGLKFLLYMSRVVRKPDFCICENKDADQLHGNHEADQRLCFCYRDSTISLLPKYEISSLQPSSVAVHPGLCGTWSETPKTGFLTTRLI